MSCCRVCGAEPVPYPAGPRGELYYLLRRAVDVFHLARLAAYRSKNKPAAATCSAIINTIESLTEQTQPPDDPPDDAEGA